MEGKCDGGGGVMGEGCERSGEGSQAGALPVESLPIPSQRAAPSPAALSRDPGARRAGRAGGGRPHLAASRSLEGPTC